MIDKLVTTPSTNLPENPEEKTENIEKLFGHCFEIKELKNGSAIPVGGSIFGDEHSMFALADFEHFDDFFNKVDAERKNPISKKTKHGLFQGKYLSTKMFLETCWLLPEFYTENILNW